ncbi:MAG: HAMP domain-containing protein [Spirochaetaceae bacterium]|nr:MAG: HAMP domain-containing protein [Spirochaetaceae bacterium]
MLILAALGVLIVLIIGAGMQTASRALQRPLHALATAAQRFAAGDLQYRTSPDTHPVVADVAATMNQMASQLQSRIQTVVSQQQELEALFSSMAEGIIVLASDGTIARMNHIAANMFNANPEKDKGRPLLQVARNSMLDELINNTKKENTAKEKEIQLFGPVPRTLSVHATCYQSQSRSGILLVLHDITEIRRLETVRRDFVANVSHELKTPITSISGFIETIMDDPEMPQENLSNFLRIVSNQSQRLQAIIEDLLSLSRIEEHGRELPKSNVAVLPLMQDVIELCRHAAETQSIKVQLAHEGQDTIHANANLLEQALFNLLQNAIKYSPAGSQVIMKSSTAGVGEDAEICFSVEDSGTGIPQKDIPRLFERFYRVDRARSRELGGTGLGLAIVKHIALAHNGRVSVQSTLGKGSRFEIHIPATHTPGN